MYDDVPEFIPSTYERMGETYSVVRHKENDDCWMQFAESDVVDPRKLP